jgi:hypothetical protein
MKRRVQGLMLGLILLAAVQAHAQERARFADPPADRGETTVRAWLAAHVEAGPYGYVASDADGAHYLFAPRWQDLLTGDAIRVWVRTEFFNPQLHDALTYRSSNTLREFDCEERRVRDLAADAYPLLNLQGEAHSEDAQAPKWRYLRLGEVGRDELRAACALRETRRTEQARSRSGAN